MDSRTGTGRMHGRFGLVILVGTALQPSEEFLRIVVDPSAFTRFAHRTHGGAAADDVEIALAAGLAAAVFGDDFEGAMRGLQAVEIGLDELVAERVA